MVMAYGNGIWIQMLGVEQERHRIRRWTYSKNNKVNIERGYIGLNLESEYREGA